MKVFVSSIDLKYCNVLLPNSPVRSNKCVITRMVLMYMARKFNSESGERMDLIALSTGITVAVYFIGLASWVCSKFRL